ncbi:MAG: bifunctional phosphoribosylaminoimidazolecarboxamide formyltransferase/IMP cyclohydrolase [Patescibacteria group bacterium]|jgi:phosphoribosylaminoimidazolecarboxamide formyltransferase/IMP cyclohydrolase
MRANQRALISVSDKRGIIDFARVHAEHGWEIVSSGGTSRHLTEAGIPVRTVEEVTGFPEILGGRVKTLHPKIHGGILADQNDEGHMQELFEHSIYPFDMVVVNLYPFEQTVADGTVLFHDAIEQIDIGGVALIRAAAKNHQHVVVVTSPEQYGMVLKRINVWGFTDTERRQLAYEAFLHTAWYDAAISDWLAGHLGFPGFPDRMVQRLRKKHDLRYGENPHQAGALYEQPGLDCYTAANARQIWGKSLSATTVLDINAGIETVRELYPQLAAAIIKHGTPCGVGVGDSTLCAFQNAMACDPESAFGGVVVINTVVTEEVAEAICRQKVDAIVALEFSPGALEHITAKRAKAQTPLFKLGEVGVLTSNSLPPGMLNFKPVTGGMVVQRMDTEPFDWKSFRCVTKLGIKDRYWPDIMFGCKVSKHVKSNSVIVVWKERTIGIGNGQTSRIKSARLALEQASNIVEGQNMDLHHAVLVSDSFFPFDDCVRLAAEFGIKTIVQQGGSMRDQDSIKAADELGIAMLFTGRRMFWH